MDRSAFGMHDDGVHLATGPLYHNGPLVFLGHGALAGNHIVVWSASTPRAALAPIERTGVDWMYAVPTMMQRIWKLPEDERTATTCRR